MQDLISRQAAIEKVRQLNAVVSPISDDVLLVDKAEAITELMILPSAEPVIRCKDCRWGSEVCGNIECSVDSDIFTEYHGYEWFCPNGERKQDATS